MDGHSVSVDGRVSMPAEHLQVMIAETPVGGVLEVPEAVYVGSITIDRPITLVGIGDVLIDGAGQGTIVTITAADVAVRNLNLAGTADGPLDAPSGLLLEGADRAHIEDVTIRRSYIGITVRLSDAVVIEGVDIRGHGTIVGESHVTDADATEQAHRQHASHDQASDVRTEAQIRGDGIWLWNTTDATVRESTIADVRDGVYVSYGRHTTLEGNRIVDSRYAVHDMYAGDLVVRANDLVGNLSGLVLMYGGPVTVAANIITESGSPSTGFGVLVKDVGSVTIEGNVIADNRIGVQTDDAGRTGGEPTILRANTIAMNAIGSDAATLDRRGGDGQRLHRELHAGHPRRRGKHAGRVRARGRRQPLERLRRLRRRWRRHRRSPLRAERPDERAPGRGTRCCWPWRPVPPSACWPRSESDGRPPTRSSPMRRPCCVRRAPTCGPHETTPPLRCGSPGC